MKKVVFSNNLIDYLKDSRGQYIMENRAIGEKIAQEYLNEEEILDYELFLLIEEHYHRTNRPVYFSDYYDLLKDILVEQKKYLWADLENIFDKRVKGKTQVGLDAIALGFVEGIMKIWPDLKHVLEAEVY